MTLQELMAKRAQKTGEMRSILDAAKNDGGRDLTEDEQRRFAGLETEASGLNVQIDRERRLAEMERMEAPEDHTGNQELRHQLEGYSLASAINGALAGRLTGREAEAHQELTRGREARSGNGIHLAVPTEIILGERRSQSVGSDPAGGYTVTTNLAALADRFRPALRVEGLGATVMPGLTGFLDLPNMVQSGSVNWVDEGQSATRSAATFGKVSMGPKTVTGEYKLTRRIMLQSQESMEQILRRDLGFLTAQALDRAAINGSGTGAEPLGILNTTGVEKVTTETLFSDTTANLIAALELDDVMGSQAFLTNPTVMKAVRKIKDNDEHVIPAAELFHQMRHESSTQVPTDIGAGSDKSALVFGQWAELYIGYWSAVDILINPYHPDVASSGGALLHSFLDADIAVRHAEAFAYAEI